MRNIDRGRAARIARATAVAAVVAGLCAAGAAPAQLSGSGPLVVRGAEALGPFQPVFFYGDLRDLPVVPAWQPGDPIQDIPDKRGWPIELRQPLDPPSWSEDPLRIESVAGDVRVFPCSAAPTRVAAAD